MRRLWPFVAVLALGLAADLATKAAAFASDAPGVVWIAGEWLGLTRSLNPGAVWGVGREQAGLLLVVRLVAAVAVLVMGLRRTGGPGTSVAWGLVGAGALGNLCDNLTQRPGGFTWHLGELLRSPGQVRDFIHVDLGMWPADPWPDFNVADAAILIGVGLLALGLHRRL